jgi:hypothetical protein
VCFLSVALLYSVMSLPHAPDVFFYMAGLAVVAMGPEDIPLRRGRPRALAPAVHDQRERVRSHTHVSRRRGIAAS